jgi:hypothetical protein
MVPLNGPPQTQPVRQTGYPSPGTFRLTAIRPAALVRQPEVVKAATLANEMAARALAGRPPQTTGPQQAARLLNRQQTMK